MTTSFSTYSTLKALPSLQQFPLFLPLSLSSNYNHPYNNNNLQLAKTVLKFPLEIIVGERSTVNKVCYPFYCTLSCCPSLLEMTNNDNNNNQSPQDITQFVEVLEEEDKFLRLLQLLGMIHIYTLCKINT